MVRLTYAGADDGDVTFTFTIEKRRHKRLVVAIGMHALVHHMSAVDDPNGADCHLKRFFWEFPTNAQRVIAHRAWRIAPIGASATFGNSVHA